MTATHKRHHRYEGGGCGYCGFHCIDCPPGVAVCKCTPLPPKPPGHQCSKWCHIHWDANYGEHVRYPHKVSIRLVTFAEAASTPPERRYFNAVVHIGPAAFFPYRPDHDQMRDMRATCAHSQMDLTCNTCLRHTFHPLEI